MRKKVLPRILIFFGVILAITLFLAQGNLREDWGDLIESANIHIDNFFYTLNPGRSRPISTLEKEQGLKLYAGRPFIDFGKPDWDKFWDILYGVYAVDYLENERLPPRAAQLTYAQMEARLKEWHPQPFAYFQDEHWRQFWQIVFGKKSGRR